MMTQSSGKFESDKNYDKAETSRFQYNSRRKILISITNMKQFDNLKNAQLYYFLIMIKLIVVHTHYFHSEIWKK